MPPPIVFRQCLYVCLATGLVAPASSQPCSPEQIDKLLANNGQANDRLGEAVSISGNTVVIGSRNSNLNGELAGAAYVYRNDGTGWVQEGTLIASDGQDFDFFGESVSISNDLVAIGSPSEDENGHNAGAVYIYRYNGKDWLEETKLVTSDGQDQESFGRAVSIAGNAVVIGAQGRDETDRDAGAAYIFRFNGTDWVEEAKLTDNTGKAEDFFGSSVAINGDTAVVGEIWGDDSGFRSGSAIVFNFNGNNWVQTTRLIPSDGRDYASFGRAVSISGSIIVVGASGDGDNGFRSGTAYVFRFNGTQWEEEAKLLASNGSPNDSFGYSASVSNETIIIGTHSFESASTHSGSAYIYRSSEGNWEQVAELVSSDGAEQDFFGIAVAIDQDTAVIGAALDDDNGNNSGSAYIFKLSCTPACPADVNGDGMLTPTDFTAWVGAFNNQLPECDQNGDGSCAPTDFSAWVSNYNAGC